MNRPYTRDFTGTADWVALSETALGFRGNLGALPSNGADLELRIGTDEDTEIALVPGEFWQIDSCNISSIQIKGNGLVLRAFGVTSTGW